MSAQKRRVSDLTLCKSVEERRSEGELDKSVIFRSSCLPGRFHPGVFLSCSCQASLSLVSTTLCQWNWWSRFFARDKHSFICQSEDACGNVRIEQNHAYVCTRLIELSSFANDWLEKKRRKTFFFSDWANSKRRKQAIVDWAEISCFYSRSNLLGDDQVKLARQPSFLFLLRCCWLTP